LLSRLEKKVSFTQADDLFSQENVHQAERLLVGE